MFNEDKPVGIPQVAVVANDVEGLNELEPTEQTV
jgi:hypothetical protein